MLCPGLGRAACQLPVGKAGGRGGSSQCQRPAWCLLKGVLTASYLGLRLGSGTKRTVRKFAYMLEIVFFHNSLQLVTNPIQRITLLLN